MEYVQFLRYASNYILNCAGNIRFHIGVSQVQRNAISRCNSPSESQLSLVVSHDFRCKQTPKVWHWFHPCVQTSSRYFKFPFIQPVFSMIYSH